MPLERSDLADNALQCLHDEAYDDAFNTQNLNAANWLTVAGRRPILQLDGDWRFAVDLLDTGLRQRWYEMQPMQPEERTSPWDYDPHDGDCVTVPSCWALQKERWYFFEGSAWYSRRFALPSPPTDAASPDALRYWVRVGAAHYDTKVFIDGVFLGNHYGGSTPFVVELTGWYRDASDVSVMLCVNNTRTLGRVPMRNTDWFNYGGVYRSVAVYATPAKAVIRDVFVRLDPDDPDMRAVQVSATLEGDSSIPPATVSIPALGIEDVALDDPCLRHVSPHLWSPSSPVLYYVIVRYGEDTVTERVGFRRIQCEGTRILLNGSPIFLRGISVHEDDRDVGKVCQQQDLRRRFQHARDLGCNFLRLAHYPHHEDAARLADELGFLLWEEIPVYWAIAFDNAATLRDARNQLLELIQRDRNRASVIIWSVGNENPDTDARLAFMTELVETARAADPTRLTSAACLVNHRLMCIQDRLADIIDVIGINEYYGWYEEDVDNLRRIGENSKPDRPVVISETGADAAIGAGAPSKGLFSEEYQKQVYQQQIRVLRDLDYVQGISPWILYDFRVERRQNIFQRGWNKKGLIAADKTTKKAAFYVLQQFYHSLCDADK